jgi:hypothetical protein
LNRLIYIILTKLVLILFVCLLIRVQKQTICSNKGFLTFSSFLTKLFFFFSFKYVFDKCII